MNKVLKIIFAIIIILLLSCITIYLIQDKTKLLEDRKYKDINEIIIDSDVANITFYKSEDDYTKVVIYGLKSDKVELIEGSNELNINKHGKSGFCLINCENKIDIYLANDLDSLSITTDVGNVNTKKININSLNIKSDVGNIDVGSTNVVNITTNVGNVSINEIKGNGNSSIKTDVGNINIDKINNLKIESNVDIGNNDIVNSDGEYTLKLETNVGSIKVKNDSKN